MLHLRTIWLSLIYIKITCVRLELLRYLRARNKQDNRTFNEVMQRKSFEKYAWRKQELSEE